MTPVIETEHLSKRYGPVCALQNVCLQVDAGEICGFLGPNGAGKSTFVKVLLDLTRPDRGRARLFGIDCRLPAARNGIGFLPENIRAYSFLRVDEFVGFHARLAGCRGRRSIAQEVGRALELAGMQEHARKRIDTLSKGMLQRVGIAQALTCHPRLLILDEPTSGLDPIGITELRMLLLRLKAEGLTVFFNSHLLSEVERTCDRVAILHRGRIVRLGTRAELAGGETCLEIGVDNFSERVVRAVEPLCEKPLQVLDQSRGLLRVTPRDDADAALRIHQAISENGGELRSLNWCRESLEELFYRLIKHADTDNS